MFRLLLIIKFENIFLDFSHGPLAFKIFRSCTSFCGFIGFGCYEEQVLQPWICSIADLYDSLSLMYQ